MRVKSGYRSVNGDYVFTKTANAVEKFKQLNPKNKVVDLGVGDVNLPPIKIVSEELKRQATLFCTEGGFSGYPKDEGDFILREKISNYYKSKNICVYPDEVFITEGIKPALAELLNLSYFNRAYIHLPNYPLYGELCKAMRIKIKWGKREYNKIYISDDASSCDLFFICSPCNPTGSVILKNDLEKCAFYAHQNNGIVIFDGAYASFCKNYVFPQNVNYSERIIELRSFSKSLSFTGLRCGYAIIKRANPLYNAYKKSLTLKHNGVNIIAQKAAAAVFCKEGLLQLKQRINEYKYNFEILKSAFFAEQVFQTQFNAPYLFARVNKKSCIFAKELLSKKGVCVTSGQAFGTEGFVRLSCLAKRQDCNLAAQRINDYLAEYL